MSARSTAFATVSIAILSATAGAAPSPAAETNPLSALAGSWRGSGSIRFEGGKSEALTCRGNYTSGQAGARLNLALRCASATSKIELRSALNYANGKVSGAWEERTFNASGQLSGHAKHGRLDVAISGGGLSGRMAVNFSRVSQTVSIETGGDGSSRVAVRLHRE